MRPPRDRDRGRASGIAAAGLIAALLLAGAGPVEARQVQGQAELGLAVRPSTAGPLDDRLLNAETRLLLERQWYGRSGEMFDLRVLTVQEYRGDAQVEIRQASLYLPLGRRAEIIAGRQVLSWGPGQFEFVNDRFAKDFEAFFVGHDLEYLKAPNDAFRARAFLGPWTVDAVLAPVFQPDRLPDPDRFPVMDPTTGAPVADPDLRVELPDGDLSSGELHLRIDRPIGRWETALYGFRGFTGSPRGVREIDGVPTHFHPEMAAVGMSLRGPALSGLGWVEAAYESIREDGAGASPGLPPDRWLALAGYRWNPDPTHTLMIQGSVIGQIAADELRDAWAGMDPDHPLAERAHFRLQGNATRSLLEERMQVGARVLWGITEAEAHLRLRVGYDVSDDLTFETRLHGFVADHPATRFGLLRDHDLVSLRLRYHF